MKKILFELREPSGWVERLCVWLVEAALLLFLLVWLAIGSHAQVQVPTTTLTYAVNNQQAFITPASLASIVVGSIVYADSEAMQVTGINQATRLTNVARGQLGTPVQAHNAGITVLVGDPSFFQSGDPSGACSAIPATPYINVRNGNQWVCSSGTWTLATGAIGAGSFTSLSLGSGQVNSVNDLLSSGTTIFTADSAPGFVNAGGAIALRNGLAAGGAFLAFNDNANNAVQMGASIALTGFTTGGMNLQSSKFISFTDLSANNGFAFDPVNLNLRPVGTFLSGNSSLQASQFKMTRVLTVATLPTCNAGAEGTTAAVSDAAAAPVYNATATGGGAIHIPVYCNGTNWTNH